MKVRSRTRKKGKIVFFMDYRLNGRRYQETIPLVQKMTEAQQYADLRWAKIVYANKLGNLAPSSAADRCLSLGDALDSDLQRLGISEWTRRMERVLSGHLKRHLGSGTPVMSITTDVVERYKCLRSKDRVRPLTDGMEDRGVHLEDIPLIKSVTVNKDLEYLRSVLNRLKAQKKIQRVPCEIVKLPTEKKRSRSLTEKQLLAVLSECAKHSEDMLEKTVFFANTGFRKSELFNAKWADLEHTPRYIRVLTRKKGTSNEYYEDLVPLNKAAQDALRSRRSRAKKEGWKHDLIFGIPPENRRKCATAKPGAKPGTVDGIECYWDHCYGDKLKKRARAAGVSWWEKLTIHHLRHSFATLTLEKGANIMEVARLIRHRDPMLTVRTYLHTQDKGVIRAVDSLNFGLGLGGQVQNKGTNPE